MTKSEIFKAAHKLAKQVVAIVGDYMIALSYSLKKVYAEMKNTAIDFGNFNPVVTKNGFGNSTAKDKLMFRAKRFCSDVYDYEKYGVHDEDIHWFEEDELRVKEWPSEILKLKAQAENSGWEFNF